MKYNREAAISETLKWEGGYVNHPADPGGATNYGITIADAKRYWKKDATPADVKAMPKSVAINIYQQKYWKTPYYDCDNLASGVDLAVFDFGVNSGPSRAKKFLDRAVGGSAEDTVVKICDARLSWLQTLKIWPTFGKGWTRRCKGIKAKSLELAKAKPPTSVPVVIGTGGVVATGAAVATTDPVYWPWIFGGAVLAALVAWVGYEVYSFNKAKVNGKKKK